MDKQKTEDAQCGSTAPASYLAVSLGGETFQTDSARDMATFMWGKSVKRWTIYKRIPFRGGDVDDLRDALESR